MLGLLCALNLFSCIGSRMLSDPTLVIQTRGGTELGVSTDYGLVFLGHTARSGEVTVKAWYGDGPNLEETVIEPLGGGLYTGEIEIRLPSVPVTFVDLHEGDRVTVRGRMGDRVWTRRMEVITDPRVYGLLLDPGALELNDDQIGAGVFWLPTGDIKNMRLVGLISGRLELQTSDGTVRKFLTVKGPEDLWKLVTYRRDDRRKKSRVKREDIQ
ncbi:MAG: hypothetical protein ACI841_002935 [Planctomycetota bacterium]